MLYKVKDKRVCSEDYLRKVIGDINNDKFLLANKIISVNTKEDERRLYISRCKELVYKLNNSAYLTLSDISRLNKLLVSLRINHKFDLEQYERFVDTNSVVTFAGELKLDEEQEDFIYLSSIQNPLEYGISMEKYSYQDLQSYLSSINKFIYRETNRTIHNGSIDKNSITDDIIVSSNHGVLSILDDLNKDSVNGQELAKKYAYRKHL